MSTFSIEMGRPGAKRPAPQAFYRWLRKQQDRRDPVGDLARDAISDPDFPKTADYERAESYLSACWACDGAFKALRRAFAEFHGCIYARNGMSENCTRGAEPEDLY